MSLLDSLISGEATGLDGGSGLGDLPLDIHADDQNGDECSGSDEEFFKQFGIPDDDLDKPPEARNASQQQHTQPSAQYVATDNNAQGLSADQKGDSATADTRLNSENTARAQDGAGAGNQDETQASEEADPHDNQAAAGSNVCQYGGDENLSPGRMEPAPTQPRIDSHVEDEMMTEHDTDGVLETGRLPDTSQNHHGDHDGEIAEHAPKMATQAVAPVQADDNGYLGPDLSTCAGKRHQEVYGQQRAEPGTEDDEAMDTPSGRQYQHGEQATHGQVDLPMADQDLSTGKLLCPPSGNASCSHDGHVQTRVISDISACEGDIGHQLDSGHTADTRDPQCSTDGGDAPCPTTTDQNSPAAHDPRYPLDPQENNATLAVRVSMEGCFVGDDSRMNEQQQDDKISHEGMQPPEPPASVPTCSAHSDIHGATVNHDTSAVASGGCYDLHAETPLPAPAEPIPQPTGMPAALSPGASRTLQGEAARPEDGAAPCPPDDAGNRLRPTPSDQPQETEPVPAGSASSGGFVYNLTPDMATNSVRPSQFGVIGTLQQLVGTSRSMPTELTSAHSEMNQAESDNNLMSHAAMLAHHSKFKSHKASKPFVSPSVTLAMRKLRRAPDRATSTTDDAATQRSLSSAPRMPGRGRALLPPAPRPATSVPVRKEINRVRSTPVSMSAPYRGVPPPSLKESRPSPAQELRLEEAPAQDPNEEGLRLQGQVGRVQQDQALHHTTNQADQVIEVSQERPDRQSHEGQPTAVQGPAANLSGTSQPTLASEQNQTRRGDSVGIYRSDGSSLPSSHQGHCLQQGLDKSNEHTDLNMQQPMSAREPCVPVRPAEGAGTLTDNAGPAQVNCGDRTGNLTDAVAASEENLLDLGIDENTNTDSVHAGTLANVPGATSDPQRAQQLPRIQMAAGDSNVSTFEDTKRKLDEMLSECWELRDKALKTRASLAITLCKQARAFNPIVVQRLQGYNSGQSNVHDGLTEL